MSVRFYIAGHLLCSSFAVSSFKTLRGFFAAASSTEKQPVVIAVDGILIAASIQQAAPSMENQPLPEYAVYFSGCLTGVNGIPDAEHEAIVQIAANRVS